MPFAKDAGFHLATDLRWSSHPHRRPILPGWNRNAPDARSGAMGDAGLATTPDPFSIHWNPAKTVFAEKDMAFGISYTPWLRELVGDIYAANIGGYKKLGERQALSFSLLYFSLGDIQFTDINGQDAGSFNPREFFTYSFFSRFQL